MSDQTHCMNAHCIQSAPSQQVATSAHSLMHSWFLYLGLAGAPHGSMEEKPVGVVLRMRLRPHMAARFWFCLLLGFGFRVLQKSLL